MELSVAQRERLQDIAREAKEIVGGCLHDDGRPMTFAELEDECIEAGDLFTATMLQQLVAERPRSEDAPDCPTCDRPGTPSPDEPRVLQTDRGEVSWMEPTYYCRHCRRSFFPRSAELGLAMEDTVSPRVLAKMVYSGTSSASFTEASKNLANLANLSISAERVRRACGRVAQDRIDKHRRLQEAFQSKPLPEQSRGKPADVEAPEIACVMCDGGRYQLLDRSAGSPRPHSARKGEHWKESRIGLIANMRGEQHSCDPQPTLPPELRYEAMAETLSEIGKTGGKLDSPGDTPKSETTSAAASDGLAGPTLERRSVVASRGSWDAFGPLLASQAWHRGFAAAARKVFVSDGSAAIEKLQRKHFSHYTSVLDILHALSYSLAAARAVSDNEALARQKYNGWAEKIWEGRVDDVIDELIAYGAKVGEPPPDVGSDDPREIIRTSRVYYENHVRRMNYPSYRRDGLPLTSSLMESTVKQVSRRVKGSEKYWSSPGGEAILRLRGEYLSDDNPMRDHWENRSRHAPGTRAYRPTPETMYN